MRQRALAYAPREERRYFAQLQGYQVMPVEELFDIRTVALSLPLAEIISRPGVRVECALCGEEIIKQREVRGHGMVLCRGCAGEAYYTQQGIRQGYPLPAFRYEEVSELR